MPLSNENKEYTHLVPVSKAAEEFGVHRQTIINWHDEGLLQGTTIKGNRFVTRDSLEKLKTCHPSIPADAAAIDSCKSKLAEEREKLEEQLSLLKKERIYRGYAPVYVKKMVEKVISLMKILKLSTPDGPLVEEQFILCWLFGHDINTVCKENGISISHYMTAVKKYREILDRLDDYATMSQQNYDLKIQMREMKNTLRQLQLDVDDYRKRYTEVEKEQQRLEDCPILTTDLMDLNLSNRMVMILGMHNITTLGQVLKYSRKELLSLRHFGNKSLIEIEDILEPYGIHLK